jgi:RNA polymerase sigma factor (sigma-70 family)
MLTAAVVGRRADLVSAATLRLASDQRLAELVHVGSERAFEALVVRHRRPVLAFCTRMLGSREEAEDIAQLTFLAAYGDLVLGEPPSAVRPWLYAIARHRCLSVLRARRDHEDVRNMPAPLTDDVAETVATREELRLLLADVARLPHEQHAALALAVLEDLPYPAIARILACPPRKVKALVFQARSSLTAARDARETPCADTHHLDCSVALRSAIIAFGCTPATGARRAPCPRRSALRTVDPAERPPADAAGQRHRTGHCAIGRRLPRAGARPAGGRRTPRSPAIRSDGTTVE